MWKKSEGIYRPKTNPSKSIPYVRWTHKVDLSIVNAEHQYLVAVSKWRETFSVSIFCYKAGKLWAAYCLCKKISSGDFNANKHKYIGEAFEKAKEIALVKFKNDLFAERSFQDNWDDDYCDRGDENEWSL